MTQIIIYCVSIISISIAIAYSFKSYINSEMAKINDANFARLDREINKFNANTIEWLGYIKSSFENNVIAQSDSRERIEALYNHLDLEFVPESVEKRPPRAKAKPKKGPTNVR